MVQQYRGSAVDIVYTPESLREIFVNNVRLLKTDRMVQPERVKAHPLEAFFGRASVTDAYTREEEDAFEYVCRHTLLRPRDLMTIGDRVAGLRPDERRHEHRLKEAVNQAATEIAQEYLNEIAPYVGDLDLDRLFEHLPGPVLTRAEVDVVSAELGIGEHGVKDPIHALYRVGLLGYVQHDRVRGEWRQRFLRPGEATLDSDGALPRATHYLVHPVLAEVIAGINPAFAPRADRANVIGYDRPWREAEPVLDRATARTCCVLMADVHGFAGLMRAGMDAPVRAALESAAQRWAPPAAIVETQGGDALLMAADDPVALAQTARHLMDQVYEAPGQPRLRIALHHGEVQVRAGDSERDGEIVGGDAVLCAARVEPVVEPGQIWCTEEFRQQFLQRPSLWRTTELAPPGGEERFNVRKPGSDEADLWVRLYRLES
jgi:class 3 adenylate cyclase